MIGVSLLHRTTQNRMPKLKVPGESLKTKDRPSKSVKAHRRHHPSKDVPRRHDGVKKIKLANGTEHTSTTFYKIFGQSDDEVC